MTKFTRNALAIAGSAFAALSVALLVGIVPAMVVGIGLGCCTVED